MRESCGSLAAAAIRASEQHELEMANRHRNLEQRLQALQLTTVDVFGDGNCFYRAACFSLHGNDKHFATLRQDVADHIKRSGSILGGLVDTSPDDGQPFSDHVLSVSGNGVAVGEDAIVALANVCRREVHVYIAYADPLIYKPNDGIIVGNPVSLAFFEPGHYRAVVHTPIRPETSSPTSGTSGAPVTSSSFCQVNL